MMTIDNALDEMEMMAGERPEVVRTNEFDTIVKTKEHGYVHVSNDSIKRGRLAYMLVEVCVDLDDWADEWVVVNHVELRDNAFNVVHRNRVEGKRYRAKGWADRHADKICAEHSFNRGA